jgi:hypothetical protein
MFPCSSGDSVKTMGASVDDLNSAKIETLVVVDDGVDVGLNLRAEIGAHAYYDLIAIAITFFF